MGTTIGSCAIEVSDLDRAARFYTEAFGLKVLNTIEMPGLREVILGGEEGGSQLMLACHDDHGPIEHGTGFWKVYLNTDDVEAAHRRAVEMGAVSQRAPERLDRWPVIVAFVDDLDGYRVELLQNVGATAD